MEQKNILKIDLSSFPIDEHSAQIPNKLFLIDNLNDPVRAKDNLEMQNVAQVSMIVIFVCKSGRLDIQIDRKDYTMRSGDLLSLTPGTVFQFINAWESTECAVIAMDKDFMNFTTDIKLGIELARQLHNNPITNLDYPLLEETISIYKALKHKLYSSNYQYKEEVAQNYLNILKCNVYDQILNHIDYIPTMQRSSRKEELFGLFLKAVQKHYKEERSVTFYADKLCVTPKYLSAVIHEVSGRYATEWITSFVIMEAKNMLKNENRTVKDVCNTLCFANQSFFAKYFKQHTGHTPKEFKEL